MAAIGPLSMPSPVRVSGDCSRKVWTIPFIRAVRAAEAEAAAAGVCARA